jgi:hypothetical protein
MSCILISFKEMRLIFPGAQRLNRGSYEFSQLMDACRANNVTDFLVVHEHRGIPDGLIVCHLPHGPTAYFTLSDIVMRHDIPDIGGWWWGGGGGLCASFSQSPNRFLLIIVVKFICLLPSARPIYHR